MSEQVIGWGKNLYLLNLSYFGAEKEVQEVPCHTLQVHVILASLYFQ